MEATINYLAVALAALAAMALGWLWYSPVMFQKRWMKEVGMKPKDAARAQQEGVKAMGFMFLATLVMAYVLAHFVDYLGATDAREALWAGSWIWVGFVATVMPDPAGPTQENAFITGKVAMVISGDWKFNQMAQLAPDTNYGFTYIPVPNEGDESATWAGGWSAALIPDSDAPDEAWRFIQYLAGPEGQAVYTKDTFHMPTLSALLEDDSLFDERHAQFRALLETAHSRPPLKVGALYWDALTSAQGSVELNTAEPEAALQEVADAVQPELDVLGC